MTPPATGAATGLRYLGVGAVATLAHYGLLWLAVEWGNWPPPLAAGATTNTFGIPGVNPRFAKNQHTGVVRLVHAHNVRV